MYIGVDYTSGIRQPAGIGEYTRNLMEAIFAQDTVNTYCLIASDYLPHMPYSFPVASNVHSRCLGVSDRWLNKLWYQYKVPMPATYFTGHIDIYYGPDFVLPPLPGHVKKVVTIHDLAFLEHPEYSVPKLTAYLKKVVPDAVRRADKVTAVSEATKHALMHHYHTPEDKIIVVPNAIGEQYKKLLDEQQRIHIEEKFHVRHPLVLCVGTPQPRKNHKGLIKAFHQLQGSPGAPEMLIIAGGQGWLYEETLQTVKDLHLEEKVQFPGRVTEEEKIALYSIADVFVYPSFSEGFGIPVLEAMACGTPVITSNIPALAEIAQGTALLIDPYSVESIANAMQRVLHNTEERMGMVEKGYKIAAKYTWERSAEKMLDIFNILHEQGRG
jgi:glycosyltransferase involved in cell wall biosynthesis